MILPALRGYYTNLEANHIRVGCSRCKCERVIYHKENCKDRQYRFPAYCFSCDSMIEVEVRKVKGGGVDEPSRRRTKPTNRNVVRN